LSNNGTKEEIKPRRLHKS